MLRAALVSFIPALAFACGIYSQFPWFQRSRLLSYDLIIPVALAIWVTSWISYSGLRKARRRELARDVIRIAGRTHHPERAERRRACVMVWHPIFRRYVIDAHWQMEYYDDCTLRIRRDEGVTGTAASQMRQTYADPGANLWALADHREQRKVPRGLQCILGTPVRHPRNLRKIIAVFNIDSLHPDDPDLFKNNVEFLNTMRLAASLLGKLYRFR